MHPLDPAQPSYGYAAADPSAPPAVSVITPYYNTGPMFLETARALLRQSLQQWEWIIVNDGTSDPAALRALLPFRSADARIRVVDQPNRGLPAARNAGAALTQADLLFFLDSDDLLAPTALEKLAWSLASHPGSAFATGWNATFGHKNFLWPRGFETRYAFLHENMTSPQVMVRRSTFDTAGGFDEARRRGMEDYEFWLRCASKGMWGHDVHEYLIWVRSKAPETYTSYRWSFQDDPSALATFNREMRARYPQLYRHGLPRVGGAGGGLLGTYAPIDDALPLRNPLATRPGQRRILLLMPWARIGGADRFALDMAAGLVARGDLVSVALLRDEQHTLMDELLQITPDVFNLAAFLAPADFPRFLRYLIESRQITTVVLANSLLAYQLLPYLRAHCPGVAMVDYLHMEEDGWRDGGLPRAGIDHEDYLDMHIVASQHLGRWMAARGARPERTEVCPINIDEQLWRQQPGQAQAVRAELGLPPETTLLLFPARLVAQKRPRLMAAIVRRLRERGADVVCLVAGGGEDSGWLRRYVRTHRLQRHLRLLGPQPSARVRALMDAAEIVLLPSEQEGIALALYEAMAMGAVPVAADVGGQSELVTPACGVLIPPGEGELDAYVDAIERLIASPQRRTEMAEAGRARIEAQFTHQAMLSRMQALFDQAAALAQADPRPPVSAGQGHAAAALAIEHHQLETRLRGLPPVRLALRLRQSPIAGLAGAAAHIRSGIEQIDRTSYMLRRAAAAKLRSLRGAAR